MGHLLGKWRVGDDEIIGSSFVTLEVLQDIILEDSNLIFDFKQLQILADDRDRFLAEFDRIDMNGAARNAFASEVAGTGKEIKHASAVDVALEFIEDTLFHPVGCRANVVGLKADQTAPPKFARDNSHVGATFGILAKNFMIFCSSPGSIDWK